MKKVLFTIGLILASALSTGLSSLYAQTEQQVVVSEYKGKEQKTPLSGVSVTKTYSLRLLKLEKA
jgi:hypothetical protein